MNENEKKSNTELDSIAKSLQRIAAAKEEVLRRQPIRTYVASIINRYKTYGLR